MSANPKSLPVQTEALLDEDDDPDPDDEYHCPNGCGRTMERIQLHKGTAESGYTALLCSRCGRCEQ